MLLLERIDAVQTGSYLFESPGISIDPVGAGSSLGSQILQIERRRVQAGIKFLGPGIDFGYAADRRFDALEPGKQAILGPFQLGSGEKQRIADLRGMRQLGQTGLQLLLLVLRQFRPTQLVQLKGNILPVAAALLGPGPKCLQLALATAELAVYPAILPQPVAGLSHAVEQTGPETAVAQQQRLVLRMNIDQSDADLAQGRQLDGKIVDVSAALAGGRNHPPHDGPLVIVHIERPEQRLQAVTPDVELGLDDAVAPRVLDRGRVGASSQHQPQRAEQDRLAGSGLAGNDIQPGSELDVQPVNQRIILDRQTTQHIPYELNGPFLAGKVRTTKRKLRISGYSSFFQNASISSAISEATSRLFLSPKAFRRPSRCRIVTRFVSTPKPAPGSSSELSTIISIFLRSSLSSACSSP